MFPMMITQVSNPWTCSKRFPCWWRNWRKAARKSRTSTPVPWRGKEIAGQQIMAKVFEVCDRKWQGVGPIPGSGLKLREEFAAYDAEKIFDVAAQDTTNPGIYQRTGAPRVEKTSGLHRFWQALHPREPARRTHGFVGRRVRSLLSVSAVRIVGAGLVPAHTRAESAPFGCPRGVPLRTEAFSEH